jgi:uncharacterized membrane protein
LFPSAGALFFTQSLFIALGAVPVFLLGRKLFASEGLAFVMAACYLLHPAVGWTNRENYHPDSFVAFFVGMAIYTAIDRRWRWYAVFVVLALLVKEDVSLVVVPIGIWVAIKRDRRIGLVTVLSSLGFMLLATYGLMRSLIGVPTRNGWRIPFGGPLGVLKTLFTDPQALVRHFVSEGRPFYFWQMTIPMAWAFMAGESVAMISSIVLGANMLSTFSYQHQIQYHYSLIAVPAIVMGTIWAISKIAEQWRSVLVLAVALSSLWAGWAWGALPFSQNDPYSWPASHPVAVAARQIIADIPADAVVAAQYSITPHLSRRTEIYMFPTPFSAEMYGVDDSLAHQRLPAADRVDYVVLPTTLEPNYQEVWNREVQQFTLITANEWWRLYERTSKIGAGHSLDSSATSQGGRVAAMVPTVTAP